jgi:hypothetical protein
MSQAPNIGGVLITWGDRLFYPGNRVVKVRPQPKLGGGGATRQRAAAIRERIEAPVVRRAPQVMVRVTGGGRGMKAIAAHFRYISRGGRLDIEDERGETMHGKDNQLCRSLPYVNGPAATSTISAPSLPITVAGIGAGRSTTRPAPMR